MSKKLKGSFKTYAQLQLFIAEVLKASSHRAAHKALSKVLVGKEVTSSIMSAVLIAAGKQKSTECAIQFMQFSKNIYNFQFSSEHFTLAVRCGVDHDLLLCNFFDKSSPRDHHQTNPEKAKHLTAENQKYTFQYRTYSDIIHSPLVKYYIAQKILRDGRDTSNFIQAINTSFSYGASDNLNSYDSFRTKCNLFAKINSLFPFASSTYSKYRPFAVKSGQLSLACIRNLPNIIAATNPDQKREMMRLHNMGLVSIQSLGSSLAVSFLNISPGMTVLDLCAAPGNKTLSILEKVGPHGSVIANDQSPQRAKGLLDRFSQTPTTNLFIANFPAVEFPSHIALSRFHSEGTMRTKKISLDRILVDISCSGDGRILKDPRVLRKWSVFEGVMNFASQREAVMRALHLVDLEGFVLYCTCSMNPIENEAVVASVLRAQKDAIRIMRIDHIARDERFDIKLRPGMTTWGVPLSQKATQFKSPVGSYQEARESSSPDNSESLACLQDVIPNNSPLVKVSQFHEIFPHHTKNENSTDEWITKSLHECRRLMVTDNDEYTTGFFFALFKKVKDVPSASKVRPMKIEVGTNRRMQALDALGISKEFFHNFVIAFHAVRTQVSYIMNKALSRMLGASCLSKNERLYLCDRKISASNVCQLSVDGGKTLTHQAAQIIGPYAIHTRVVKLDFKAFIHLIQFRKIGESYFVETYSQLENKHDFRRSLPIVDLPFMQSFAKIHGQSSLDGPLFVTVDKSDCCYKGLYLYGKLVHQGDLWSIQCNTLTQVDRERLLAIC